MNVLYTCDDNYVWIMGISIISLFENNVSIQDLKVYLLGENITQDNKQILYEIAQKYKREIHIIDVPELDIPQKIVSKRWPLSAFTRLFSAQLLPSCLAKILYLDCDTIIMGSIERLEKVNMGDYAFAGVKDCVGKEYKVNIGLSGDAHYVNAGVLYINLNKLRAKNIGVLLEQYIRKFVNYISYADQDILNGIFYNDVCILSPQYDVMTIAAVYDYKQISTLRHPTNYYSREAFDEALKNPIIIHYTANLRTIRPWYVNSDHPFAHEFLKYKRISPWAEKELSIFKFTTKESKVIGVVQRFPKKIANIILGLIHSEIKPKVLRWNANKKNKK